MSSTPRLLTEGQFETEETTQIRSAERRIDALESEMAELREQLRSVVGMAALLKRQLAPVFSSKHGEVASPVVNDAVEKWRNRFGPTGSKLIDVLEVGPSTRNKLRPALGCGWSTLDALLKKFKDVGLIEKDGDAYRLRVGGAL